MRNLLDEHFELYQELLQENVVVKIKHGIFLRYPKAQNPAKSCYWLDKKNFECEEMEAVKSRNSRNS